MTVLPGLWDLHVHLMYAGHPNPRYWFDTYTSQFERVIMPASAAQLLMAGVTTVRDLAAPLSQIVAVRARIAASSSSRRSMPRRGHMRRPGRLRAAGPPRARASPGASPGSSSSPASSPESSR